MDNLHEVESVESLGVGVASSNAGEESVDVRSASGQLSRNRTRGAASACSCCLEPHALAALAEVGSGGREGRLRPGLQGKGVRCRVLGGELAIGAGRGRAALPGPVWERRERRERRIKSSSGELVGRCDSRIRKGRTARLHGMTARVANASKLAVSSSIVGNGVKIGATLSPPTGLS